MRKQLARFGATTVSQAIDGYAKHLEDKGTIGCSETIRRLRLFFSDPELRISRLTPERGKALYESFRQRLRPDKQPISVAYHRATLINARSFMTWAIDTGLYTTANPFAAVKGIGKRKSGKHKPTGNELRTFFAYVWTRTEAHDWTALGVLAALGMSLRSADLCRRLVRDVDLDATQLIVEDGKSEKSNEPRFIPEKLQPFFAALVAGRKPTEPLFKTPYTENGHHTRRWLEEGMARFCKAAGVPYFCPHALKGVGGTVLAKRGAAGNIIMDHLSHEDDATTFRHYVDRGTVDAAQAGQMFKVLAGGKK